MTPRVYYQDESVTLYHGRCEDVLPTLEAGSVDLVLTDPPYFGVKSDWWDRQWRTAADYLAWVAGLCEHWRRALKPNGSLYVFASPDMAARVEVTMRDHFNVLNRIRWVKDAGWHNKANEEDLRSYLSPWEEIIFAEQASDRYIQIERERLGLSMNDVDVALGYVRTKNPDRGTELCRRWEEGSSFPSREAYERLRDLLNLDRAYDDIQRPFHATRIKTDVWDFPTVQPGRGKHPCEKPVSMMAHIIRTSTRPGALVLDSCAGSGATLHAARMEGRRAIGIEAEERWCDQAARRLSQSVLPLEAV